MQRISYLYPFIELLTAASLYALYQIYPAPFFWSYFIFFSFLTISIRTDLETMLISQYVTLGAVPLGLIVSYFHVIPLKVFESIIGILLGYGVLWVIASIFKKLTGKEGMGVGDMELMAFIGSFTGPIGVWISITLGSLLGSLAGLVLVVINKSNRNTLIPFGPFLAAGAMFYVLLQKQIMYLIF